MGIRERAQAITKRGQEAAGELFVDHVNVVRIVRTTNPDTKAKEEVERPIWSGPCKVTTYEPDTIERSSGGRPVSLQEDRLHVPVSAGPFEIGDVARVVGYDRPYRIDGLIRKTFQTAQRLKVTMIANSEVT